MDMTKDSLRDKLKALKSLAHQFPALVSLAKECNDVELNLLALVDSKECKAYLNNYIKESALGEARWR